MNKRIDTIDLKGNKYAQVSTRIKEFRESNPNGRISTTYEIIEGQFIFTAEIYKNKDDSSPDASGHSYGKSDGTKQFEKLETIAIGRALATAGYMASGEIASSEEMEEFQSYKRDRIEEAIIKLKNCENLEDLKKTFLGLGPLMSEKEVIDFKDKFKKELTNENN